MTADTASAAGRARAEIETIDRELEDAFDRIIDAVERVIGVGDRLAPELAIGLSAAVTEILEAASVRDIAGQRLTAILGAVDRLAAANGTEDGPERNRDKSSKVGEKQDHGSASESGLLNGPQLPGAGRTQTEVDALFDKLD